MRRIVTPAPGRLEVARDGGPRPGRGEAKIRVEAAGVAFGDVAWIQGVPLGPRRPFTPGYDAVGVVEAVGPDVAGLHAGQRVAGLVGRGAWAETVVTDAWRWVPLPDGLDPRVAACVPLDHLSAWVLLGPLGRVPAGGSILVHGAGGGLGRAVLDLTRHMGAEAWGTASEGKRGVVEGYGAHWLPHTPFVGPVRGAGGVDLAVDHLGGRHLADSWACLRPHGTLAATSAYRWIRRAHPTRPGGAAGRGRGWAAGRADGLGLELAWTARMAGRAALSRRRLRILDTPGWARRHPVAYRAALASLLGLVAEGRLRPRVGSVHPLASAADAVEEVRGAPDGKVLLLPGSDA